jgi:hypothetical protein
VTLLEAVDFIKNIAGDRPWVINLSMGKHGEQHDGTTLVEQGLDQILSAAPGRAIVQSTGNYFDRRIHSCGQLRPSERRELIWEIEEVDPTPNQLEVWYPGPDTFEVDITGPQESVRQKAALGQQTAINFRRAGSGKDLSSAGRTEQSAKPRRGFPLSRCAGGPLDRRVERRRCCRRTLSRMDSNGTLPVHVASRDLPKQTRSRPRLPARSAMAFARLPLALTTLTQIDTSWRSSVVRDRRATDA